MAAETADAAGTWTWRIETQNGNTIDLSVTLKQDGERLTGMFRGPRGETKIQGGKVSGANIEFKISRETPDNTFTVVFKGKIEGDTIKGKALVVDRERSFDWNAKRKIVSTDPSGDWAWSVDLPDGGMFEATLRLRLEGDKLGGSLMSDNFDVPLQKVTFKGRALSYVTVDEDRGRRYLSKGELRGKTIEGTVSFENDNGEKVTLKWHAKKQ